MIRARMPGIVVVVMVTSLFRTARAEFGARDGQVPGRTLGYVGDGVRSGNCVVGFSSQPTVRIVIGQAAAERAGMHFMPAFRMPVLER